MLNSNLPALAAILTAFVSNAVPAETQVPDTPRTAMKPMPEEARKEGKIFRDWTLSCLESQCNISTRILSESGEEIFRLAYETRPPAGFRLTTSLPLYLPEGIVLSSGSAIDSELEWYTCANGICEARFPIDAKIDTAFRSEAEVTVTFSLVDGITIRLSASLMGYTAASEALAETLANASP